MGTPYRSNIPFNRLVTDCWEILQGKRDASFPRGSRAAPSKVVYVFPKFDLGYYWEVWEVAVVPTLTSLRDNPPPYQGGWDNPLSRDLVVASLSAALESSGWSSRVDFST